MTKQEFIASLEPFSDDIRIATKVWGYDEIEQTYDHRITPVSRITLEPSNKEIVIVLR